VVTFANADRRTIDCRHNNPLSTHQSIVEYLIRLSPASMPWMPPGSPTVGVDSRKLLREGENDQVSAPLLSWPAVAAAL